MRKLLTSILALFLLLNVSTPVLAENDSEIEELNFNEAFPEIIDVSATLSNDISLTFYISPKQGKMMPENCKINYRVNPDNTFTTVAIEDLTIEDDYYLLTVRFNARRINENIYFYFSSGTSESQTVSYSLGSYCNSIMQDNPNNNELVNLAMAIKSYGQYAYYYFNESTDVEELDNTVDFDDYSAVIYSSGLTSKIKLKSASLVLDTTTSIKIHFNLNEQYTMDDFIFTVSDKSSSDYSVSGDYLEIRNIKPYELLETYHIYVKEGTNTLIDFTYSPMSYAAQLFDTNPANKTNLKNLLLKMYEYGEAAYEYINEEEQEETRDTYDIVFLADLGSIYDGGFNEYSFYGIRDYAIEAGLTYTYLQPAANDDQSRITIFQQAAEQLQADVIVAVGYLWDAALLQMVPVYPDIKVIYADADNLYNIDADYDGINDSISHCDNLAMITYSEEEAGFLAGYAAVMDGYRKLGFFGGMAVPSVIRYGYGFLDGAETAAIDLGLTAGDVECKYYYTGTFDASPDLVTLASNWYTAGTELVFSCGGGIVNSVIQAANNSDNRKIIGVDCDEYYSRATVGEECVPQIVTSAMKDMEGSIYNAVKAAYTSDTAWRAYTDVCTSSNILRLGYAEGGVCLADYRAINWNALTEEQYNLIYTRLNSAKSSIHDDEDGVNGAPLSIYQYIVVDYIEY